MPLDCAKAHGATSDTHIASEKVFSIVELRVMILEQVRITDLYAIRQVSAAINTTLKETPSLKRKVGYCHESRTCQGALMEAKVWSEYQAWQDPPWSLRKLEEGVQ